MIPHARYCTFRVVYTLAPSVLRNVVAIGQRHILMLVLMYGFKAIDHSPMEAG